VIEEYRTLWHSQRDALASEATNQETLSTFRASYPLHPDVLETFTTKMATLGNFQRVRGMLRILGRTVSRIWELTRLTQSMYVPAIRSDIAGEQGKRALAQELDDEHYRALPPYTT
jgi:predicted AAA+ superfamily ATPase